MQMEWYPGAQHGFIAAARGRMRADPSLRAHSTNLLEAMIAAADEPDIGIDDRLVAGNVLTMLLAGEDSTANTVASMSRRVHRLLQAATLGLCGGGVFDLADLVVIEAPHRHRAAAPEQAFGHRGDDDEQRQHRQDEGGQPDADRQFIV
jgi:hypothetical protein